MNWGHKIIIVFILFAAGMLTLVVKSMRTRIDMVTADYYAEELKYQQQIDARQQAERLTKPVHIAQAADSLEITFPPECASATGAIVFYRPSDSRRDVKLPLSLQDGKQRIPRTSLDRGNYRVRFNWEMNGTPYFQETQFFVQ